MPHSEQSQGAPLPCHRALETLSCCYESNVEAHGVPTPEETSSELVLGSGQASWFWRQRGQQMNPGLCPKAKDCASGGLTLLVLLPLQGYL